MSLRRVVLLRRVRRKASGSGPIVPEAPTIIGTPLINGEARVGKTLSVSPAPVTGEPTPTNTYQWERNGTPIGGATNPTYTLVTADEGNTLTVVQTATNSEGSDNSESAATPAVVHIAPSASGGLLDQTFTENTGDQTYDVSGDFAGKDLSYAVQTGPAGVTVNDSGVVTFDTDTLSVQSGTSIVIRATNSGGFAVSGFSLKIEAVAVPIDLTLNNITFTVAPSNVVASGYDALGLPYVNASGDVTVNSVTPAQTTDGSDAVNGAMLNPSRVEANSNNALQGWDERLGDYSAGLSATYPLTMSVGDRLLKTIAKTGIDVSVAKDARSGIFQEEAPFYVTDQTLGPNDYLGPAVGWGGSSLAVYTWDVDAAFAALPSAYSAPAGMPTYATLMADIDQYFGTMALRSSSTHTSGAAGYQVFSPTLGVGGPDTNKNYGGILGGVISMMAVAYMCDAYTDAERKQIMKRYFGIGLHVGMPYLYSGIGIFSDGGHNQFWQGPLIFALQELG